MMLLEHDAKGLLTSFGINEPTGHLVDLDTPAPMFAFPWVVKAQVPVGGRGKAGGIAMVTSEEEYESQLGRLIGSQVRGHTVRHCRVEQVSTGNECYLSLLLDPSKGCLVILASQAGGMDVESQADKGGLLRAEADFSPEEALAAIDSIAANVPEHIGGAFRQAGGRLIDAFFALELTLAEINPLFVRSDGSWTAGDAKVVADDNAISRQKAILDLVQRRAADYPDVMVKLDHGFDFLRLDPDGDIGMLTTGAGLSMQLIDELIDIGCRPFNFCDIRTGQFRGSPDRMIHALQWMAEDKGVKVVLINFFAGVTDLGELAPLILQALDQVPNLHASILVRLIGNRLDQAVAILEESGRALQVESDLDVILEQVRTLTGKASTKPLEGRALA